MNFIATMPKVMVFDVSFFDVNGNLIKKNFKIPKVINFEDVILPSIDDDSEEENPSRYEVFAAIGFDRENRNSYVSLVKKQLKEQKVNQWYCYSEGNCNKIKRKEALLDYLPQMLFYRPIDETDEYESESDDEDEILEIDSKKEAGFAGETEEERMARLKKSAYQQQLPDDYWEKMEKSMTDMNMKQDKERLA